MKLSMSLIGKYMKKYNPECHILEDTLTIKGVRFFTDEQASYSREYVYLDTASHYFQDPHYADALLLANGQNQIICRGAGYEELLNDVLAAFDYYNTFEQKLYIAAANNRPLQEIMEIIETVLDCPLLVFDIDGNLVGECHKEIDNISDLHAIRETRFLGTHTIGQVFLDKDGNISHDLTNQPQLLHIQGHEDVESVSIYLCQKEERIGFALMFVSNPEEAAIGMCIEPMLVNACAQAEEFTEKTSVHQSNHSILMQLLNKEEVPAEVIQKFKTHLALTSNPLLLTVQNISIQNYTHRRMLCRDFSASKIPGLSCEFEKYVVILTDEEHVSNVLNFIISNMTSSSFSMGVSMPIQRLKLLHIALEQSIFALQSSVEPGIRYCRNVALPYLMQNLRQTEMSENLRHPIIELLMEYDKKNETELLDTLRAYVHNGCRQAETAQKMHIHLNTLKYRLHRIEELSNVNFKNYEELFYIQISLAL
jgi:hypothetical protein